MKSQQHIIVPHNRLTFGTEETQAVTEAVSSGYWAMGPRVEVLERTLAERVRVPYCVAVSSGLSALTLVLQSIGVGHGDEVIIPAYGFVALPNAVLMNDATIVAADIRKGDWNIDPDGVRKALTPKTKAIIAVNTFGVPAPVEELAGCGVPVIEDCAHGFGIKTSSGMLGARSDVSILSFYATKPMGAGEGGAILTKNNDIADAARLLRDYDDLPPSRKRGNHKMNDLEGALAHTQLKRLDDFVAARQERASRYLSLLSPFAQKTQAFALPPADHQRVWYRFVLELLQESSEDFMRRMESKGIAAIRPVKDWREAPSTVHPIANHAYRNLVSLPLYPTLTDDEQDAVCRAVMEVAEELKCVA